MSVLSLALAAAMQSPAVAFLDAPREIKVWSDRPVNLAEVANRFTVQVNGKSAKVVSVTLAGEAVRERRLPKSNGRVILAGTLQSALGGKEWDPDGELTQMTESQPGVFSLAVKLNVGRYEFKVTRDGSWNENYGRDFQPGGANIALTVPANGTIVKFVVNFNNRTIKNSLDHPSEVQSPSSLPAQPLLPKSKFNTIVLKLAQEVPVNQNVFVLDKSGPRRRVFARDILNQPGYLYSGADLGSRWAPSSTTFRTWSPVSSQVEVLFRDGRAVPMKPGVNGTWTANLKGNLHGAYYQYRFRSYGEIRQTQDLNCYSASPDSRWSMVVNLAATNPTGWPTAPLLKHRSQTDAILYELSVRDFTKLPSSGVTPVKRGTYAGMIQPGTVVPGTNFKTGLDYLKDLGVTDIHFLPTQNFLTSSPNEYTWGYATNLFNVPEETYSTQPNKPIEVIREYKQMVQGMHGAGLRVVLDVVYNHTWPPEGKDSAFWQTAPYYFVRTNDRGDVLNESGVGNALADERPMARKFVRDSLLYWLKEYKVDGFRFDLLGLHNPESVKDWAKTLRAVRPDVVLYGEPWTGGGPNRFPKGTQRGTGFAVFNDDFRNAFRGDLDGNQGGFIMGAGGDQNYLQRVLTGSGGSDGFTNSPQETVNYISAHDNLTLLDRIAKSVPQNLHSSALKLAGAAVLLAQGVPFLEGGAEIGRTKEGNHNTYNAGDALNGFDWARAAQFADVHETYRSLIRLRRENPGLRLSSAAEVNQAIRFLPPAQTPPNTVAYTVTHGGKHLFIVLHGGLTRQTLPANQWSESIVLEPLSFVVKELVIVSSRKAQRPTTEVHAYPISQPSDERAKRYDVHR